MPTSLAAIVAAPQQLAAPVDQDIANKSGMDKLFTFQNVKISANVTLKRAVRVATRNDTGVVTTVTHAYMCQETRLIFIPLDKVRAMVVSGTIFDRSMAYSSYTKKKLQLAKLYGADELVCIFTSYSSFAFNCRLDAIIRRFARQHMLTTDAVCNAVRDFAVLEMTTFETEEYVRTQKVPRPVAKSNIKLCPPSQYSRLGGAKVFLKLPNGQRVQMEYGTPSGHRDCTIQLDDASELKVDDFEARFKQAALDAHVAIVASTRSNICTYRINPAGAPPAKAKNVVSVTAVHKRRETGTGKKRSAPAKSKKSAPKKARKPVASKSNDDNDDSEDDGEESSSGCDDDESDELLMSSSDKVFPVAGKSLPQQQHANALTLESALAALTPSVPLSQSDEAHIVKARVTISDEQRQQIAALASSGDFATDDQRRFFTIVNPQVLAGASDELLLAATSLSAKAWREVQAAIRTTRWSDFMLGVQRAFNQMLSTGTPPQRTSCVPGAMAFDDARRTNPATPALRRIAERFMYDDGTTIVMWGVQALRALPAGTDLGSYGGRRVTSVLELHGEEALYRSAGIGVAEAQDAYALEYVDDNELTVIQTTREDDRSLLSLINHCAAQANCHFVANGDHVCVGVPDPVTGVVRGDIQEGDCLYINYGASYISRSIAIGLRIARPAGIAEYAVVAPPPPVQQQQPTVVPAVESKPVVIADHSFDVDYNDECVWPPRDLDASSSTSIGEYDDHEFGLDDDDSNDFVQRRLAATAAGLKPRIDMSMLTSPMKPSIYDDDDCSKTFSAPPHPAFSFEQQHEAVTADNWE